MSPGRSTHAPVRDRYPSRVGGDAGLGDRLDPVVWGDADGPLSPADVERFDRYGFLVVPELVPAGVVEGCMDDFARLAGEATPQDPLAIYEPDSDELRSLFDVHRTSDVYAALVRRPELLGVARQLLADDVYIHQSRINVKRAYTGRSFPWHSDFETWHVEDGMPAMRAVSCSIALTDNHPWNGQLLLIAGSHRTYLSFPGSTPEDNHLTSLRKQSYGVPTAAQLDVLAEDGTVEQFTGPPGSVCFFDCNTMHGSPDNISPVPRTNLFFVYNALANALVEPFGTDVPRPNHIADRSFEPLG